MKLVHIISGLQVGGAEMLLVRLAERLAPLHVVEVISLSGDGPIGAELTRAGARVTALGMKPGRFGPVKFLRLIRHLGQTQPEIVHTWMYHADLLGGLAARIARVPAVVWSIHHSNLSPGANKRTTILVARLCAILSRWIPDRVVCVAHAARRAHLGVGYASDKMIVIPNGYDIERFRPDPQARRAVRMELGLGDDTPLVGCIGRFHPQKGHAVLVDAAARLRARVPKVRFLLAGRDVDGGNPVLARWIEQRNLADAVFLLGYRSDAARLMASLDAFVLPSVGEGMPGVVGEAMACAVPCVVTDVGDVARLVGDTGFVRPAGDGEGLAEALALLLEMPPEERAALGMRARRRITENYEIGAIVRRYDELYRAPGETGTT